MTAFAQKKPFGPASLRILASLPPLSTVASALLLGGMLLAGGAAVQADWLSARAAPGVWALGLGGLTALSILRQPEMDGTPTSTGARWRRGLRGASLLAAAFALVLAIAGSGTRGSPSPGQQCMELQPLLQRVKASEPEATGNSLRTWAACTFGAAETIDVQVLNVAQAAAQTAGGLAALRERYLAAALAQSIQADREAEARRRAAAMASQRVAEVEALHEAAMHLLSESMAAKERAASAPVRKAPRAPQAHALLTRLLHGRGTPAPVGAPLQPTDTAAALQAAVDRVQALGMEPQHVGLLLAPQANAATVELVIVQEARRRWNLNWTARAAVGSDDWRAEVRAQAHERAVVQALAHVQPPTPLPTLQTALEPYLAVIIERLGLQATRLELEGHWLPPALVSTPDDFTRQVLVPIVGTVAQTVRANDVRGLQGWIAICALLALGLATGLRAHALLRGHTPHSVRG